jgi:thioredoxin 1
MKGNFPTLIAAIAIIAVVVWAKSGSASPYEEIPEDEVSKGIAFVTPSWKETIARAKKENKLVFLDAYASWCGSCKLLKKRTFPDEKTGKYFNEHFISVAIDMEKGDGPALARQYGVDAYPTLIITDTAGKPVSSVKGYMEPGDLIDFGKNALDLANKK